MVVSLAIKSFLDSKKIHRRESYDDVLRRLFVDYFPEVKNE